MCFCHSFLLRFSYARLKMCFVQPFVTWWGRVSGVPQLQPRSLSRRAGWLWRGRSWAGAWWSSGGIWRLCWGSSRSCRLPRDPLEPGREKIPPLSEWASNRPTLSSTLRIWIVILGKALCFLRSDLKPECLIMWGNHQIAWCGGGCGSEMLRC